MQRAVAGAEARPSLLYTVKQVELVVRARLDELLRPAGVTVQQYTALTVLARRDGLSAAELARNSFVTAQTMGDLVTALLRRGLVARSRDPRNRRQLLLSLTEAGRAVVSGHAEPVRALEQRMVEDLTPDEQDQLRDLLNRCRANLTDRPAQ